MKKHLFILFVLLSANWALKAQVSSISYTFSPTVQYNWWDENGGIEDGIFIGGQLGFGFGQNVELSAIYLQSFETNSIFPTYDFSNAFVNQGLARQLNITRYGGNVKLNLSNGTLLPFLSLGTGIQRIELDGLEDAYLNKRIYFDAGLGVKLSVADRYTLNLSAVNHYYEMNPVRELMTLEDREALNVDFNDYESLRMNNWGARASLIVYLGGKTPEKMSSIEKAYMESFSTDYSGFSMPLEPTFGKIKFHERLPYRDTWYVGGATGFNFGPMVGVRAYYWRGMDEKGPDDTISTQTDDIAVYGAEGRFQMAVGQGLKPYILLGGGQIDPLPGYVGRYNFVQKETPFASGGIGINIPFSKAFKFDAYAKAILTSGQENIEDTSEPDDILASYAYGASLNLVLGKKRKMDTPEKMPVPGAAGSEEPAMMLTPDGELVEVPVAADGGTDGKNGQEGTAGADGETKSADDLKAEIARGGSKSTSIMIMTPAEFENIIDEILDRSEQSKTVEVEVEVEEEQEAEGDEDETEEGETRADKKAAKADKKAQKKEDEEADAIKASIKENKENIEELEELINDGFRDLKKQIRQMSRESDDRMDDVEDAIDDADDERRDDMKDLKNEIKDVEDELEDVEDELEDVEDGLKENKKTIEENGKEDNGNKGGLGLFGKKKNKNAADSTIDPESAEANAEYIEEKQRFKSPYATKESFGRRFVYDGMATYVGFNLGGTTSLNFGFRPTYKIDSSNLKIAPEAFFGFGSPSSFGIIANVISDINIKQAEKLINPYVGAGFGFMKIERGDEDKVRGVINLLGGAHVASVGNGRLFVEYATRNFLKYNQFIAGYRLAF